MIPAEITQPKDANDNGIGNASEQLQSAIYSLQRQRGVHGL
jgi:hypothetical protein